MALFILRRVPEHVRSDNNPELVSATLLSWVERQGIAIRHIQPGKPQQNAYVERYNRTVRHERMVLGLHS